MSVMSSFTFLRQSRYTFCLVSAMLLLPQNAPISPLSLSLFWLHKNRLSTAATFGQVDSLTGFGHNSNNNSTTNNITIKPFPRNSKISMTIPIDQFSTPAGRLKSPGQERGRINGPRKKAFLKNTTRSSIFELMMQSCLCS